MGGVRERGFGRRERAVLVFHGEIAGHVRMQLWCTCRQRILRLDHGRKIAIFDRNVLDAVARGGFALRHHERHRLADKAHALVRERMAVRQLERASALAFHEHDRRRGLEGGLHHVRAGQDGEHAGHGERRAGIDRHDLGVGMVAAQEAAMRLTFQIPVGGVFAASGNEASILAPAFHAVACVHCDQLSGFVRVAARAATGVPIPKFAILCNKLRSELRNQRGH